MAAKRGLPKASRQPTHHYLEEFSARSTEPLARMIPIDRLVRSPSQPRFDFSGIKELSHSIREKGVIEPLIVRPTARGKYEIVAGERRFRAGLLLSLKELPCIERPVDKAESLELSLIENLQRKDLHPFEEANGLKTLAERFGYTHQAMARKLGKSRTAITETMGLSNLPDETRALCLQAGIKSKNILYRIMRTKSTTRRHEIIEDIAGGRYDRELHRRESKTPTRGRPRNYVFRYAPEGKPFSVTVSFRKSSVDAAEVKKALRAALRSLA